MRLESLFSPAMEAAYYEFHPPTPLSTKFYFSMNGSGLVLGLPGVLRMRGVARLRRLFAHLRGSGRIAALSSLYTEFF